MAIQMDIQRDKFLGKSDEEKKKKKGKDGNYEGTPLDDLLTVIRASGCSEPHDRIFAILGLTHPRHAQAPACRLRRPARRSVHGDHAA
jgi:hypothetical protein